MKICCIADTQLDKENTKKYLNAFKPYLDNADYIIHLGDGIENSIDFLSKYKNMVYVKGNHDKNENEYRKSYKTEVNGVNLLFVHGDRTDRIIEQLDIWKNKIRFRMGKDPDLSGYYRWLADKYNEVDMVIYGHIHIPRIEVINKTCYFCPGGMAEKRLLFGHDISIGVININDKTKIAEIDIIGYNASHNSVHISAHNKLVWEKNYILLN